MSDDRVMEPGGSNRQDGARMSDPQVRRRSRSAAAVPLLAAAAAVVAYAVAPAGRTQALVGEASVIAVNLIAAASILARGRTEESWRSSTYLAVLMGMVGLVGGDVVRGRLPAPDAGTEVAGRAVPAVPDPGAGRGSRGVSRALPAARTGARSRSMPRLIAASLAAICYAIIRPVAAGRDRIAVGRDVRDRVGHALRRVRRPHALDPVPRTHRPMARLHDRLRRHRRLRLGMDAGCVPRRASRGS